MRCLKSTGPEPRSYVRIMPGKQQSRLPNINFTSQVFYRWTLLKYDKCVSIMAITQIALIQNK